MVDGRMDPAACECDGVISKPDVSRKREQQATERPHVGCFSVGRGFLMSHWPGHFARAVEPLPVFRYIYVKKKHRHHNRIKAITIKIIVRDRATHVTDRARHKHTNTHTHTHTERERERERERESKNTQERRGICNVVAESGKIGRRRQSSFLGNVPCYFIAVGHGECSVKVCDGIAVLFTLLLGICTPHQCFHVVWLQPERLSTVFDAPPELAILQLCLMTSSAGRKRIRCNTLSVQDRDGGDTEGSCLVAKETGGY